MIFLTAQLVLSEVKMLLDNTLLENKRFEPDYSDCPINRVIADVVEIMRAQANMKQINLEFFPLRKSKLMVKMDLQRTQQILINFLSNAIKFSPTESTVKVSLSARINKSHD